MRLEDVKTTWHVCHNSQINTDTHLTSTFTRMHVVRVWKSKCDIQKSNREEFALNTDDNRSSCSSCSHNRFGRTRRVRASQVVCILFVWLFSCRKYTILFDLMFTCMVIHREKVHEPKKQKFSSTPAKCESKGNVTGQRKSKRFVWQPAVHDNIKSERAIRSYVNERASPALTYAKQLYRYCCFLFV